MEQFNDQQIQEARSVIRAIGGEHATGGDKRLALRRHFALDSFEDAHKLQQAAEDLGTWEEAFRVGVQGNSPIELARRAMARTEGGKS